MAVAGDQVVLNQIEAMGWRWQFEQNQQQVGRAATTIGGKRKDYVRISLRTIETAVQCHDDRKSSARSAGISQGHHRRTSEEDSAGRSEEHTSELQSQSNLVCRLLL